MGPLFHACFPVLGQVGWGPARSEVGLALAL